MRPCVGTLQVHARTILVGVRLLLILGVFGGLPGLYSEKETFSSHSSQSTITKALSATPAQANEDAVSGDTASRLNEWPDLFGQSSKTPSILPVKKTQSSSPLKTGLESTLPPISKKKISPPQDDGFPTLHSVLKLEENPVPWASVQTGVESNLEQPQVKAASLESPIQEVKVPNEKTPDPKTDSPPAVNASLSKPVSDLPLADSKPSIASAKSSEKKKTSSSKKGFVIKVEGEGKELVVYDAEGNEVLRKSRKKENEGTTISGSGKTVTNRTETEKTVESKTELVESTDPAVKEVPQGTAKTSQPKLIFDEVKKGENLSLIASRYPGIDAKDLMKANQISDPHCIAAGTKIWIPQGDLQGLAHRVEKGETLSSLLKKYEIKDMFQVCELNGLNYYSTNKLDEGQMLIIPEAKTRQVTEHTARAIRSDLSKLKGNVRWQWPVVEDFKVSSSWGRRIDPFSRSKSKEAAGGPKPRFSMHHGIDLAVPVGTPVQAAREGEVIEVSRSRYGHGNMIKIRHDDGWCTVYSHNSELLKKEGDQVKQGDLIALSGNSGRSTGPHLHFEIRRPNQESVNPKSFLPPS